MKATHGGARQGAGRPPGVKNRATIEREALAKEAAIRAQAARLNGSNGPSPDDIASMTALDVMAFAMVQLAVEGEWTAAAAIAKDLAPYRHAKLSQVKMDAAIAVDPATMTDEQLAAIIASSGGAGALDAEESEG